MDTVILQLLRFRRPRPSLSQSFLLESLSAKPPKVPSKKKHLLSTLSTHRGEEYSGNCWRWVSQKIRSSRIRILSRIISSKERHQVIQSEAAMRLPVVSAVLTASTHLRRLQLRLQDVWLPLVHSIPAVLQRQKGALLQHLRNLGGAARRTCPCSLRRNEDHHPHPKKERIPHPNSNSNSGHRPRLQTLASLPTRRLQVPLRD